MQQSEYKSCASLKKVTLPNNIDLLKRQKGCNSLKTIKLPNIK